MSLNNIIYVYPYYHSDDWSKTLIITVIILTIMVTFYSLVYNYSLIVHNRLKIIIFTEKLLLCYLSLANLGIDLIIIILNMAYVSEHRNRVC